VNSDPKILFYTWHYICQGSRPGDDEGTFSVFESCYYMLLPV